jgi:murein DD-endopeptidase MepM/ murein hydrolase activator NlpD
MAIINYPTTTKFHEVDNFHPLPHSGTDYAMPLLTPVEALEDAVVTSVSTNDMLGNNIRLKTHDGKIIVYGHLAEFKVKENQVVSKGDIIGLSGGKPGIQGSGHSTGPHLHLSVYASNGSLEDPNLYLINQTQQHNNLSSPLIFPVIAILLLFVVFKMRRVFFYGLSIFAVLLVIFIAS